VRGRWAGWLAVLGVVAAVVALLFAVGVVDDGDLPDGTVEAAMALCAICWSAPPPSLRVFASRLRLTERELQVARCASTGSANDEIAAHLGISRRTVETHLQRAFTKLGVHNRTRLAYVLSSAST